MKKKIYYISGFDCANCANKAEAHLNKDVRINYAHLDFASNRLYLTFNNEILSIDEIKKIIAEVESDPIEIIEGSKVVDNNNFFTKQMKILILRIAIAFILTATCFILFDKQFYWIRFTLFLISTLILLYDIVLKVINHIIHKENIIDHNLLITISSVGAFVLSSLEFEISAFPDEHFEAVMVVMLFQIGRIIESIATNKSKSAIMSAISLRVESANVIRDNEIIKIRPEELLVGDKIIIKAGEIIPSDCSIIEGECYIDTSSLTGEYVPVKGEVNSLIYSGCLVKSGTVTAKVVKEYSESTISKIINLIETGGEKKSKADEFISKFAKVYTPVIVLVSIISLVIGGLISQDWNKWVMIGLEILVTGCPCAIIISVPLAYFSAIGLASKNGIVVKGANYLDLLNNLGKLITDKTGTLTHGSFSIQKVVPFGINNDELINYLVAVECLSTHPIGKAICHGKNLKKLANEQKNFKEHIGLGVESTFKDVHIIAGNYKMMSTFNIDVKEKQEEGLVIYCAIDNKYVGYVVLSDELKEDAQPMINLLHSEGVEIILLTGDKEENAKYICEKLGIDRWHSGLLPEDKLKLLEYEMEDKKTVAYIGDGINDAPSIIRSDIGIAMGGIGSDISVENADVVIMNDDPAKVYDAMKIAKMARNTSIFNIAFALSVKFLVMIIILLNIWPDIMMSIAVFADTGLTVLLVLNSLAFLYRKVKRKNI